MIKFLAVLICAALLIPSNVDSAPPVVIEEIEKIEVEDPDPIIESNCVSCCDCDDRVRSKPLMKAIGSRKVIKFVAKILGGR